MSKKSSVKTGSAAASPATRTATAPNLQGVTEVTFAIDGGMVYPIIWGENLDTEGLRVAVLNAANVEIEYADDPNPVDQNYEVYLYDPSANEVAFDSFPVSLNVEKAVVGAYKLVLTTAPRTTKVSLTDSGVYGPLAVTFTN